MTKKYNKNNIGFSSGNQLKLPLDFEVLITEDDSVRLLSYILEGLDYTQLYKAYSSKGRKPAVEPKTLFKILTYAYIQYLFKSTDRTSLPKRYQFHVAAPTPDHTTISRFRTKVLPKIHLVARE